MTGLNSQELLTLFRDGHERAAEVIFDRYVERLLALARSRIAPRLTRRVDADDVVQSAYRSFFVHARDDAYRLVESGDLWRLLASITLHKVHKQVDRHRAAKRSVDREDRASIGAENARAPKPSASEVVGLVDELQAVFATLSPQERQVLSAHLRGDSLEQIGSSLGKSDRTIRRLLAEAKQKVERRLLDSARCASSADGSAVEPVAPLVYSDFVLERLIGAGGMGKVFRAHDRSTASTVAIKALHKARQSDKRALLQFVQEANVLAALRHPNIVGVRGLGRFPGGGYFIVMDFVEGGDLQGRLGKGPLAVDEAVGIAEQIASAVGHAHEHGIVHCDLKPGNVLLGSGGRAYVSDFGFAFLVAGNSPVMANAIGGTAGYIAPEVLCGRRPSPRADVYGLGVLLWQMVTGALPRGVSDLGSDVEALDAVRAIVARCLAEDPRDRFESVGEFLERLDARDS